MELNGDQYERIGLWLDGEAVELTPEEQAVAREIRAGEASLAGAMGAAAVPGKAMRRARRAIRSAAGRRWAVRARFVAVAGAGAAVAATILVAWAIRLQTATTPAPGRESDMDAWVQAIQEPPGGAAIHQLARELDRFEAELAVSRPPEIVDWQIDSVQQAIDSFWQDEPPAGASDEG